MDNHQWRVYFRLNLISNSFIFSVCVCVCVWRVCVGAKKIEGTNHRSGMQGRKREKKKLANASHWSPAHSHRPQLAGRFFPCAPENQQQLLFSPSHSNRHLNTTRPASVNSYMIISPFRFFKNATIQLRIYYFFLFSSAPLIRSNP